MKLSFIELLLKFVVTPWFFLYSVLGLFLIGLLYTLFDSWMPYFRTKTNYDLIIDDRYVYNLKDNEQGRKSIKISEHPRSQIGILAYNPGYTFDKYLDADGKLISGSTITTPPKLYLYCGNFEYSFPAKFSQAELWWLGQELSDFLNLELQVIYPTPKVPPAPSCGGGC